MHRVVMIQAAGGGLSVGGGFQTTLLNYRLMETLREMKSLSDRGGSPNGW